MKNHVREAVRRAAALAAMMALAALPLGEALAQGKKPPAKDGKRSFWVKLCGDAKLKKPTKTGVPKDVDKNICMTHHERVDGRTGMVMVSAALRTVKGAKKKHFMVMLPLGMALPPGIRAAVYNKEQWAKAAKKQKVNEKELKPFSLKYLYCLPTGCTAEAVAPDGLEKQLETGGGLMILALNHNGRPIAFPVPLQGFKEANDGKPVDMQRYGAARYAMMQRILKAKREREIQARTGGRLPPPKPITK